MVRLPRREAPVSRSRDRSLVAPLAAATSVAVAALAAKTGFLLSAPLPWATLLLCGASAGSALAAGTLVIRFSRWIVPCVAIAASATGLYFLWRVMLLRGDADSVSFSATGWLALVSLPTIVASLLASYVGFRIRRFIDRTIFSVN